MHPATSTELPAAQQTQQTQQASMQPGQLGEGSYSNAANFQTAASRGVGAPAAKPTSLREALEIEAAERAAWARTKALGQ